MKSSNANKQKDILVIIPAYNEQDSIERVIEELKQFQSLFDYVIINDGSKDNTSLICHKNGYHIIDLPVNLGLSGAFQTGMKYAFKKGYQYAIQFDADGQHRPQFIENMRKKMDTGCDIVIGSRFVSKKKDKSIRMLGNNLISIAIQLTTGKKINDTTSGMRMFNRKLIEEFAKNINYEPEPDTLSYLISRGIQVEEIQVDMASRIAGQSYLTFTKSIMYMVRMLTSILIVQNFRTKKQHY